MNKTLTWLPLILLLSGCPHPAWLPDRNLKEYLASTDVVGEWQLTPESLDVLTRDGFQRQESHQYQIILLKDGTCRFQTIVEEIGPPHRVIYQDSVGKWELAHDTDNRRNTLILEVPIEGKIHRIGYGFTKKNGALVCWTYYGDPDSWKFIEYTKITKPVDPQNAATPRP